MNIRSWLVPVQVLAASIRAAFSSPARSGRDAKNLRRRERHAAVDARRSALRRAAPAVPRPSPAPSFAVGVIRIVAIALLTCGTVGALDAAPTSASLPNGPASTSLTQSLHNFFTRLWGPGISDAEKLGTAYVYDENGSLLSETGTGGANSTGAVNYIYLPTANGPMPVAAEINGQLYAVHSDHVNTPRRLTTSQGQPAWQWAYNAFGDEEPTIAKNRFANLELTPNPGTTGITDIVFNIGFMGMYRDNESRLAQNWNRYFDRQLGRYTQFDPIGLAGGSNGYLYAEANPLLFTDPDGLSPLAVSGGGAAGSGAAGGLGGLGGLRGTSGGLPASLDPENPYGGPGDLRLPSIPTPSLPEYGLPGAVWNGCKAIVTSASDLIMQMAKGGRQNVRDTGLIGVSDGEIKSRLKDPNTPSDQRKRLEKEQKSRGERNKRKDGRN